MPPTRICQTTRPMTDGKYSSTMSEREFQASVLDLARITGWLAYHTHNSRHSEKGFPDLCLVRDNACIMAELKSASGKVTAAQEAWLTALDAIPGIIATIWRPHDWPLVEAMLTTRPRQTKAPE